MKLQRNLLTNGDFFDRYAELITSLSSVATIAQIITGACEIGILYGLIYPSFVDIAPPQYVSFISMTGAVICAALLQIGLKKVYPHAIVEKDVNVHTASVYTASVGDKTKTCLHCEKSYIYSIHNQKFCCENCRVAAFESRTGKKLRKQAKK